MVSLCFIELMPFYLSCNASVVCKHWMITPLLSHVILLSLDYIKDGIYFLVVPKAPPNFSPSSLVFLRKFRYLWTLLGNKGVFCICVFFFSFDVLLNAFCAMIVCVCVCMFQKIADLQAHSTALGAMLYTYMLININLI